jgi:hypothetical protein
VISLSTMRGIERAGRGKGSQPPCDRLITRSAGTKRGGPIGTDEQASVHPEPSPVVDQWHREKFRPLTAHHHSRCQHSTACRRRFDQRPS